MIIRMSPMSVKLCAALAAVIIAAAVTACSREDGLACESTERYGSARSIPPLRVPDDLSVPDETEVLRVPDQSLPDDAAAGAPPPCLESPPEFFDTVEG